MHANDNIHISPQLQADLDLVSKYRGRSIRAFVKRRGKDQYIENPALKRLEAAGERLKEAGLIEVIIRSE